MLLQVLLVAVVYLREASAQSSLLVLVSPGPPPVPNISQPHRKPTVPDTLSPNGARQQYLLGLELADRYPQVFNQLAFNFSEHETGQFRALAKSSGVTRASAQALLQGLLRNRKGPQVSVTNPEVFAPPFRYHVMDSLNSSTLPTDLLLGTVLSYSQLAYNLLGEFEAACEEAARDLASYSRENFKAFADLPLPADDYIMPWLASTEAPDLEDYLLYYHFVAASRASKREAVIEETRFQQLRKIALLNLTSQISDESRRLSRLKTKEVYTELKKLGNHSTEHPAVRNASVMHLSDDQFVSVMAHLQMTSTECLASLIRQKNFAETEACRGFPPYSSTIVFEFLSDNNSELQLRILYNGQVYTGFTKSRVQSHAWSSVDAQLRQALFVSDEEYYCLALRKSSSLSQKLMLAFLFTCIVVLGAALLVYMRTHLAGKYRLIELKYKESNRRIYFATNRSID